jgi:hypothetical protein
MSHQACRQNPTMQAMMEDSQKKTNPPKRSSFLLPIKTES